MRCMCGFVADESVLKQSHETEESEQPKNLQEGKDMDKKRNESDDEVFFKEIDSWKISFSKKDQCVYLATPALQSFKITLTMDDLKGLLDFISEKAHIDIVAKQRLIKGNDISELIDILDKMIEVKKAKFKIKFSDEELQGIADILNKQLQD